VALLQPSPALVLPCFCFPPFSRVRSRRIELPTALSRAPRRAEFPSKPTKATVDPPRKRILHSSSCDFPSLFAFSTVVRFAALSFECFKDQRNANDAGIDRIHFPPFCRLPRFEAEGGCAKAGLFPMFPDWLCVCVLVFPVFMEFLFVTVSFPEWHTTYSNYMDLPFSTSAFSLP
jgi:hypothetical protein